MVKLQVTPSKPEVPCTCGCWPRPSSEAGGGQKADGEGEAAEAREDAESAESASTEGRAKARKKG